MGHTKTDTLASLVRDALELPTRSECQLQIEPATAAAVEATLHVVDRWREQGALLTDRLRVHAAVLARDVGKQDCPWCQDALPALTEC